jgi:hypothetical protein
VIWGKLMGEWVQENDLELECWNAGPAALSKGCRFVEKGLIEFAELVSMTTSQR